MDKVDALNQVAEFHRTFRHPVEQRPVIPSPERCSLRQALLEEELEELKSAIRNKDLVSIADAFCDLQYVLSGAILEFGLGDKFKELFDEVQRSNMSKACKTEDEAKETVKYYLEYNNTRCYYRKVDGNFLVYRSDDNKTLKSVNYSPPDLDSILNK